MSCFCLFNTVYDIHGPVVVSTINAHHFFLWALCVTREDRSVLWLAVSRRNLISPRGSMQRWQCRMLSVNVILCLHLLVVCKKPLWTQSKPELKGNNFSFFFSFFVRKNWTKLQVWKHPILVCMRSPNQVKLYAQTAWMCEHIRLRKHPMWYKENHGCCQKTLIYSRRLIISLSSDNTTFGRELSSCKACIGTFSVPSIF